MLKQKEGKTVCRASSSAAGNIPQILFPGKCDTDVMIQIKELIMSAYDLRKQREEQDNR